MHYNTTLMLFKIFIHEYDCTVTSCKYYGTFRVFDMTHVTLYIYFMTKAMPAISVWFLYGFEPMYLNMCSIWLFPYLWININNKEWVWIWVWVNQNSIQEEIKNRLKLGSACYHSVWNLLSASLLSKNL
jgi:hypothetical protein